MDRRLFLRRGIVGAAGAAMVPAIGVAGAQSSAPGASPYGSIDGLAPDEHGIVVPEGFTVRVIATAGEPVGPSGYEWHVYPDGAATFDDGDGGWHYVCNSEVFDFMTPASGGVSAIHFGPEAEILDAYNILNGSHSNCAGGPTPWGTWLSCEESFFEEGLVWECDPTGASEAVPHPAMGLWAHEAVAVDPVGEVLYLTQDHSTGVLYRYTPDSYPDLSSGLLEAATVAADGGVTWSEVRDPSGASSPTREQVAGATVFPGAEGIWYHDNWIYFTTKGDNRVHSIDVRAQQYSLIWSPSAEAVAEGTAVLTGVDNITVDAGSGDLFVAEDGGNMEIVIITPDGQVAPFARVLGQDNSEITGPVFNPARNRLYFSSQRGPAARSVGDIVPGLSEDEFGAGITFEISGPFRGQVQTDDPESTADAQPEPVTPGPTEASPAIERPEPTPTPIETLAAANSNTDDGGSSGTGLAIGVSVGAVVAAAGVAVTLRRRLAANSPVEDA